MEYEQAMSDRDMFIEAIERIGKSRTVSDVIEFKDFSQTKAVTAICEKKGWKYRFVTLGKGFDMYGNSFCPDWILVSTDLGFWKIVKNRSREGFKLLHHNYLKGLGVLDEENKWMRHLEYFHVQRDKQEFSSVHGALCYIERHDKSRKNELEGVHQMPTHTKNQRKWKRHAQNRQRKREVRRVYDLFDMLAREG